MQGRGRVPRGAAHSALPQDDVGQVLCSLLLLVSRGPNYAEPRAMPYGESLIIGHFENSSCRGTWTPYLVNYTSFVMA